MKKLTLHVLVASLATFLAFPATADTPSYKEVATVLKRSNYAGLPDPAGPYSTAVRHADTLYLSGMTAYGTKAQGQGMAQQADAILTQMNRIALAEGISLKNLIKVTIFVTDLDDLTGLRDSLTRHYEGSFPASSLVRVAGLFSPELSIEMEAIFSLTASSVAQ